MRISGVRGSIDPTSVADMWMRTRPRDESRTNQMEMWEVVGLLSDNRTNAFLVINKDTSMPAERILYRKKTCGGLLACSGEENPDLVFGGISTDESKSRFEFVAFRAHGAIFGEVHLFPSALIYDNNDRAMLFGIVQHELRHYMDFLDNDRKPIETDYLHRSADGYELDVDAYSRNITEMRAHADQAANLLRIMGGAENAKKAIKGSQVGSMMVSDMKDAMMAFIDALDAENRAAGLKEYSDPPAAVARSEDQDVRALVGHLERMCEVMRFSNNVRQKR
jgi:hypothetical protein